jgi:hypothetical protein
VGDGAASAYTIWTTGTAREQALAVVHCTGGDMLIAAASLLAALLLIGTREWPARGFGRVAVVAIILGVAYTAFSEWLNVSVRGSWAYSEWMPVIPLGSARIGLSPLAQWIIVPAAAFLASRKTGRQLPDWSPTPKGGGQNWKMTDITGSARPGSRPFTQQ